MWLYGIAIAAMLVLSASSFLAAIGFFLLILGAAATFGVRWLEERSRNVDRPIRFDPRNYYQASRRS
jgi:membrane protein implicated in regulation of membrane protease activity